MQKYTLLIALLTSFCNHAYAIQADQPLKDNKLKIIIHRPSSEVYGFTTNPHTTPLWVDGIQEEQTNQWPPRPGTIYRNRGKSGPWSIYKVTKYVKGKEFELLKQDGSTYHVNYTYSSNPEGTTKLVYHEWVTQGAIDGPFNQATLEKLKKVMETR